MIKDFFRKKQSVFEQLLNFTKENDCLTVFMLSFFLYFLISICFIFYIDSIIMNNEILFQTDTVRVAREMIIVNGYHAAVMQHPLGCLLLQPFILIFQALTHSLRLSYVLFFTIISSLANVFLYMIVKDITNSIKSACFSVFLFGFSFSALVISTIPETYIINTLMNLIILHYIFKVIKTNKELTNKDLFILIFLGTLNIGLALGNIILDIIYITFLFWQKSVFGNTIKNKISKLLIIVLGVIICFSILFTIQWKGFMKIEDIQKHKTEMATKKQLQPVTNTAKNQKSRYSKIPCSQYISFNIDKQKLSYVLKCNFLVSLYGFDIKQKVDKYHNYNVFYITNETNYISIIPGAAFLLFFITFFILNNKIYSDINLNKYLALLLVIIISNCFTSLIFDSNEAFLFSQRILIYLVIILGILISKMNKMAFQLFSLFILFEIINNCKIVINLIQYFLNLENQNLSVFVLLKDTLIAILLLFCLYRFVLLKYINKDIFSYSYKDKMYLFCTSAFVCYVIWGLFVVIFKAKHFIIPLIY